jgi:transketolase
MDSLVLARRIRRHAVEMTGRSGAAHIGGVLSVADIVAVLYCNILKYKINDCNWSDRDYLILSKGHAGIAIYSALAEIGFFSVNLLDQYYANGSNLSGHVSSKNVPGVELSTGSLGHGLAVGCGLAIANRNENICNRVYVIIGDGECDEGSIWESALFANQYNLSNLTVIVDNNKMQAMGSCEEVMSLAPLNEKWQVFGFNVMEVDGHNHDELRIAFAKKFTNNKPVCVIANTVKGKGVSFMENNILWHYRNPSGELYELALAELEASHEK